MKTAICLISYKISFSVDEINLEFKTKNLPILIVLISKPENKVVFIDKNSNLFNAIYYLSTELRVKCDI